MHEMVILFMRSKDHPCHTLSVFVNRQNRAQSSQELESRTSQKDLAASSKPMVYQAFVQATCSQHQNDEILKTSATISFFSRHRSERRCLGQRCEIFHSAGCLVSGRHTTCDVSTITNDGILDSKDAALQSRWTSTAEPLVPC